MTKSDALSAGHYARKQIGSRSRLIAWSHGARFRTATELARRFEGQSVLDYGCGDGTFAALLLAQEQTPHAVTGVEIDDWQVNNCRARLTDPRLSFERVESLTPETHAASFDALFCMEVLEHVVDWEPLFERWRWLVVPNGAIVVSVPVETGPVLLFKQAVRHVAGWRGIGDYPGIAPYTWGELARAVVAGDAQHIVRPLHRGADGVGSYCHKGFNWRYLRAALARHFVLEDTLSSPIRWLPAGYGSQVWFVLRNNRCARSSASSSGRSSAGGV